MARRKSSVSLLVGTIVGVGIFALPYVTVNAGFWLSVGYLFVLAIISGATMAIYSKIILKTPSEHRFIGYTKIYLGRYWSRVVGTTHILSLLGAQLAYLSVGGIFLAKILSFPPVYGVLGFFALGAILIYLDLEGVSLGELLMTTAMYIIVAVFFALGLKNFNHQNLTSTNPQNFFLPYGVMIFALWGTSVVPELVDLLGRNFKKLLRTIFVAMLIVVSIYLLFILSVAGSSGANTSPDAISGLKNIFPNYVIFIGSLFGFLATITSFLGIGLTLKKTFNYDLGIQKLTWLWPTVIPLLGFALGLNNYLKVISIVGAVFLGFEAVILYVIYLKACKKEFRVQKKGSFLKKILTILLILILTIGILLGIKKDITEFKSMPSKSTTSTMELNLITKDKWKLSSTFYEAKKPKAGVILVHMYAGTRDDWSSIIAALLKSNFSVLTYDSRGHGKSQGNYLEFTPKDFQSMHLDIDVAQRFLESKLDKKPIYVIGASLGANNALRYASLDSSVKKIVLLSPGLDYRGLYAKEFLPQFQGRAMIIAAEDDAYSFSSSQKIWDALPSQNQSRFIKLEGSKHGINLLAETEKRIISFLNN